jgi:hypothetical protein
MISVVCASFNSLSHFIEQFKHNNLTSSNGADQLKDSDQLRSFSSKHSPTLTTASHHLAEK